MGNQLSTSMQGKTKCSSHVHGAAEHLRAIPQEVVHSLHHCPGTHGGGAASLIGKLEVIQSKSRPKENQKNPVNQLEKKATNGNASIVFAHINATKLIFDDRHKSCK